MLPENFQCVTSLIIYAPKTLSICHHVVNKSEQGEEVDLEINLLTYNLRANPNNIVHPIALKNTDCI